MYLKFIFYYNNLKVFYLIFINEFIIFANHNYEEKCDLYFKKKELPESTKDFEDTIKFIYGQVIEKAKKNFKEICEKKEREFGHIENWQEEFLAKIDREIKRSQNYQLRNFLFMREKNGF